MVDVFVEPLGSSFPKGYDPLLVALAQHPNVTTAQVAVCQGEKHQFGNPHSGCIQQIEHRGVPEGKWGRRRWYMQELLNLCGVEGLGQGMTGFGWVDIPDRIVADQFFPGKVLTKRAQGGKPPGIASRSYLLAVTGEKKAANVFWSD